MTREILTVAISDLAITATALSTAWKVGDAKEVALDIKQMRAVLNDAEVMIKDDLYRKLTAKSAFTRP